MNSNLFHHMSETRHSLNAVTNTFVPFTFMLRTHFSSFTYFFFSTTNRSHSLYRIMRYLLLFIVPVCPLLPQAEEKPFVIVITSHNNKSCYQNNLDSVIHQNYHNYRILSISDGSTDGSDLLIEQYVRKQDQEGRVAIYNNRVRKGQLASACQAIFPCKENEIIVELDGNDWFTNREVLSSLNEIYADPDVWMICEQLITDSNHASEHRNLRSFYASLFQAIKKEDFLDGGKFLSATDGRPYLVPILEMGRQHCRSISNLLHLKNQSTKDQHDDSINRMPKYSPLKKLPSFSSREDTPDGMIYQKIKDICHPTLEDYRLVHHYLFTGNRPNLERVGSLYYWGQRTIRILGDSPDQIPISGIIHVNSSGEEKENCVILYSTYNRSYPHGLKRLVNCIAQSDFKGDILFRIGGWPDAAGGSFRLAHVPYAFKPCFFKEAQQLGYKRILWLDCSVVPVASLNDVFAMIEETGCFIMGNAHMIGPYMNAHTAAYFGLTIEDTYKIPSCSSGLFGIDLSHQVGHHLIDSWYRAAQDPDAFFSERPDQNCLSILLYQSNISEFVDLRRMPHAETNERIEPDSLFYLDRLYIQ